MKSPLNQVYSRSSLNSLQGFLTSFISLFQRKSLNIKSCNRTAALLSERINRLLKNHSRASKSPLNSVKSTVLSSLSCALFAVLIQAMLCFSSAGMGAFALSAGVNLRLRRGSAIFVGQSLKMFNGSDRISMRLSVLISK